MNKTFLKEKMYESMGLDNRKKKQLKEDSADRKLFNEFKILVDGRVFEISHTPQRRDEILEILKKDFPNSKIEVQPYNHYESGYSRKQLERIIDKQLQEYGVNESLSLKEDINTSFIKIYKEGQLAEDGWDYPLEELDYLLEEHPGESFVLQDDRLYEISDNTNNKDITFEDDSVEKIKINEIRDAFLDLSNDPYAPTPFYWGIEDTDPLAKKVCDLLRKKGFTDGDNVRNWPELVADDLTAEEMLDIYAGGRKIKKIKNYYLLLDESLSLKESYYIDDDSIINTDTDEVDATFDVTVTDGGDVIYKIKPKRSLSDAEKKLITRKVKSEVTWLAKTGSFGRIHSPVVYGRIDESLSLKESVFGYSRMDEIIDFLADIGYDDEAEAGALFLSVLLNYVTEDQVNQAMEDITDYVEN